MKKDDKNTLFICYLTNFFQATGSCFAILFLPLQELYGISFTQYGLLVSLNFIVQVSSDVLFSKSVEKYGFRPFAILSPLISAAGLALFAAAPILFPDAVFFGFCIGMFFFAGAAGLQELLLSPILDAMPIPEEQKSRSMSTLHSFFAWGQIFIVLVTTGLLALLGHDRWQWILLLWMVPAILSSILFCKATLPKKAGGAGHTSLRRLFATPVFYLLLGAIIFGGAAEVTMGQWSSAFLERGLSLPKVAGDVWGVCFFSLMLALGRSLHGAGAFRKIPLPRLLIMGSLGASALYMVCALSRNPIVGLAACGLTGFCVSLLWPGAITLASQRIPTAGAAMFALLSAGGDIGASAGSMFVGYVTDRAREAGLVLMGASGDAAALRLGLLLAALFPLLCGVVHLILQKTKKAQ